MKALQHTLSLLPSVVSAVPEHRIPPLEELCRTLVKLCVGQPGSDSELVKSGLSCVYEQFQEMQKPLQPQGDSTWLSRLIFTPTGESVFVIEDFAGTGQCLTINLDQKGYAYLGSWMVLVPGNRFKGLTFSIYRTVNGFRLNIDDGNQEGSYLLGEDVPGFCWTDAPRFTGRLEMPGLVIAQDPSSLVPKLLQRVNEVIVAEQRQATSQQPVVQSKPLEAGRTTTWHIRYLSASGAGQIIPLTESMHMGRSEDNDIVIADPNTSRHHARIIRRGARYWISDLGSSNGTYVNGIRISQSTLLHHGDKFSIGSTTFEVVNPIEAAKPKRTTTGVLRMERTPADPVDDFVLPEMEGEEVLEPPNQEVESGICPRCSAPLREGSRFCRYCGLKLEGMQSSPPLVETSAPAMASQILSMTINCPRCGAQLRAGSRVCSQCGSTVEQSVVDQKGKVSETFTTPAKIEVVDARSPAAQTSPFLSCAKCQKPLPPGVKFCRYCGTKVE